MGLWSGEIWVYERFFQRGHAGHGKRHDGVDLPRCLLLGEPPAPGRFYGYGVKRLRPEVGCGVEPEVLAIEEIEQSLPHPRGVGCRLGEFLDG